LELVEPAPRSQQRLLHSVLGVLHRAEHLVAVRVERAAVRLELLAVCSVVGVHRFCCQGAISPPAGVETTGRQPAGPSRGPSNTDAPR
jgi:hypothetical protein